MTGNSGNNNWNESTGDGLTCAVVLHELRQPVAAIKNLVSGCIYGIEQRGDSTSLRSALNLIEEEIDRIELLVPATSSHHVDEDIGGAGVAGYQCDGKGRGPGI